MRHILVDYARQHASAKRGGEIQKVELDGEAIVSRERAAELVALDEAPRSHQDVEYLAHPLPQVVLTHFDLY